MNISGAIFDLERNTSGYNRNLGRRSRTIHHITAKDSRAGSA